jgi:hypothetical protein
MVDWQRNELIALLTLVVAMLGVLSQAFTLTDSHSRIKRRFIILLLGVTVIVAICLLAKSPGSSSPPQAAPPTVSPKSPPTLTPVVPPGILPSALAHRPPAAARQLVVSPVDQSPPPRHAPTPVVPGILVPVVSPADQSPPPRHAPTPVVPGILVPVVSPVDQSPPPRHARDDGRKRTFASMSFPLPKPLPPCATTS